MERLKLPALGIPTLPAMNGSSMLGTLWQQERALRILCGYAEIAYRLNNPRMRTLNVREVANIIVDHVTDDAQRFALIRKFGLDGLSPLSDREIADALGTTPNQAHYQVHLALRILRREALNLWSEHDSELADTFAWK